MEINKQIKEIVRDLKKEVKNRERIAIEKKTLENMKKWETDHKRESFMDKVRRRFK